MRTPPASPPGDLVIWKPTNASRPTVQVGSNIVSSFSRPAVGWKTIFRLNNEPLSVMASVRNWAQGEGCRVAQSLRHGLQLSKDVHFFSGSHDESLVAWLQWHTITVIHCPPFTYIYMYTYFFFIFIDIVVIGSTVGLYN